MILILILAPQPLAPGGTCPHLPSPSYATAPTSQTVAQNNGSLDKAAVSYTSELLVRCGRGMSGLVPLENEECNTAHSESQHYATNK